MSNFPIKMTNELRLTLLNQYKILAAVEKSGKYDRLISILLDGYELHYSELTDRFGQMSEAECWDVRNALDMYDNLQYSYLQLSAQDQADVVAQAHEPSFWGYDFNDAVEGHYASYAKFLSDNGQWSHLVTAGPGGGNAPKVVQPYGQPVKQYWNSHGCAGREYYNEQHRAYVPLWKGAASGAIVPLTKDEIVTILNARPLWWGSTRGVVQP